MVDKKFREALDRFLEDVGAEEETYLLDNHAFDKSIVGITMDYILVYDYEKMAEEFAEDENCPLEEAYEWLDFNTLRALPYFGDRAPIILCENRETILEKYGN